jgi:flagellin
VDEIDRVASHAQFNGLNMLTGAFAREEGTNSVPSAMWFHIGANVDQRTRVNIGTMTATAMNLRDIGDGKKISLASPDEANRAIMTFDAALNRVSKQRADLGAYQNRLEFAVKGLDIGAENLQASESRIRDVDMAKQIVDYTKNQILVQAGNAMLAQANQRSQSTLQLLG